MKKSTLIKKLHVHHLTTIGIVVLIGICLFFLWNGQSNSSQSEAPRIARVIFEGEYKIDSGEWQEIKQEEHIPATQGDVTLRGYFRMLNPTTGEPLSYVSAGTSVSFYFNHISAQIPIEGVGTIKFDAENERIGEDACAIMRCSFTVTNPESPTTIVIKNPHRYGNENAIDEFLEHMSLAPGIFLEEEDLNAGKLDRGIGLVIVVTSIIILSIAFFSTIIHIPYNKEIWLIGLMSLFAGIYFLFDAYGVSVWNDSFITNTRVLGLSIMLYMLFFKTLVESIVDKKYKHLAKTSILISALSIIVCISLAFFKVIKFYDTWIYWIICETLVAIILSICMILSFKKKNWADKIFFLAGFSIILAFIIDAIATAFGTWEGGFLSKIVFIVTFVGMLVVILRIIPHHINTIIKAKEIEAEQQALKLELQESKISIMLSQMQPHFIFNTLNTIYHLCEINPEVARSTISSFSEYLRNNIDTLGQSEMISFEKELSFVKTYLDIEKVRFDDELEISFDIGVTDFKLPVLTVQPIVENAVKHGTSKIKGVAHLHISTIEKEDCYEICIRDTGVGFDIETYNNDGHKHIGISSVRQRLHNLCNGTLTIDSKLGAGTSAIITIPKKEVANHEDYRSR